MGQQKTHKILIFAMLYFLNKNKEKTPGDIIILHLCTKNLNDMIYTSSDIERKGLKLVVLDYFLPFYLLKIQ